jgi:hypothetical protein
MSTLSPVMPRAPVSADTNATVPAPTSSPASPAPPLSERTAFAVLGSMLFLILALTILLVQTTWVDAASAAEPPVADGGSLAQR